MVAAFAYHLNAASPEIQSGRPHSLLQNLRQLGLEVRELFPLRDCGNPRRNLAKVWNHARGRSYLLDRDEKLLRGFAAQLHAALKGLSADFIFSPSTLPLSYLESNLPTAFCADAPFCAMPGYYESFTELNPRQFALAEQLESRVLNQAALAVYPTTWAAELAIRHYGMNRDRVAVIPFGANFGHANQRENVLCWIGQRAGERPLRLLFVGREWKRKGGDLVVATASWLRRRGLDVRVDFVGCLPRLFSKALPMLRFHGSLSPRHQDQAAVLTKLFQRAHFVFVPSRAEAYGMTFCEANAFGCPILTTATGGAAEIVRSGVNGAALPLEAGPEEYGAWIEETSANRERYVALAESSFNEFETRLNWKAHCRTFIQRMQEVTGVAPASPDSRSTAILRSEPSESVLQSDEVRLLRPAGAPEEPLRVVFVADRYTDPTKMSSWSGTPFFARRALERQGIRFTVLHLDERSARSERWAMFLWYKLIWGKRYLRDRHPRLLRAFNAQICSRLRELQPDLVFSMATAPIAYLQADCPIAFWVDATFAGMAGFYRSFTDLAEVSIRDGEQTDREALGRSSLAIYSSEWAAETARRNYPVDSRRVHFVNLGANLERTPNEQEIAAIISQREREKCRLLFVGVDWKRKGADQAIAVAAALQAAGVNVRLTIIGCLPPAGADLPDFVDLVGFLSKQTEDGNRRFDQYFRESHFFVLPTQAEAYGMVFCEAGAYGLPCIAPSIGGIPSIIENGVNGWLIPPDAPADQYARLLGGKWKDREAYEEMARKCHEVYRERLNWDVAAFRVAALMRRCVADRRAASSKSSL